MNSQDSWSDWADGLSDARLVSDQVANGRQTIVIEGQRGDWREVRTIEMNAETGRVECIREECDEPSTQPEGEDTDNYLDPCAYFERLFQTPRQLGELDLTSGYLAVFSPDHLANRYPGALERLVPPGRYPFEVVESDEGRLGYRCVFSSAPTVRYRNATAELVGSGIATLLWVDATHLDSAEECIDDLMQAQTGIHSLPDGTRVAVTDTGADGGYPLLWGLDENGEPTSLLLDIYYGAPRESLDFQLVVGEPIPPELTAKGLRTEPKGNRVLFISPERTMTLYMQRSGSHSTSRCSGEVSEHFDLGERIRIMWRGRKLVPETIPQLTLTE